MKTQEIICSRVERKNINSTGAFLSLIVESAILTQEFSQSAAGALATQQLDIIADVGVDTAKELQTIPQLWRLTTSEGRTIEWGDTNYKTRCTSCSRVGNATKIGFMRLSPKLDL